MGLLRSTKFWLIGAAIVMVVVGTTVGVVLSISDNEEPKNGAVKLMELRTLLKTNGIDAYIIPSVDAHQSEYISSRDRRIAYISDFTGSAGQAIVTADAAALWTDSRYHLQAEEQLDDGLWTLMKSGLPGVPTWSQWLPAGIKVGIDPFLVDAANFQSMSEALRASGSQLVEVNTNLVDAVWTDKPSQQLPPIEGLDIAFSGKRAGVKIADVQKEMQKHSAHVLIVSALDEVAWLLNLRGKDIENNPVFYAYVIVTLDRVQLYIRDRERITPEIISHFNDEQFFYDVFEYERLSEGIRLAIVSSETKVMLSKPSQALVSLIPAAQQILVESPVNLMKIIKNPVEAAGMGRAHIRDGAALIKYLHWLDEHIDNEVITELSGAKRLGEFRSEGLFFKMLSFTAISAVGPHAAMAHYSPTNDTDRRITRDEIYLIDSGGQYLDGTTDITRTLHFGTPRAAERDAFTRVLKGFISLSRAIFPVGAEASFLDAMARRSLWDAGLNYGHGTGHGVGAYLNVHEYPPLISSSNRRPGMQEHMFTSNEPGYYEAGEFGIRIEDVVQVVKADPSQVRGNFGGLGALTFADITMAPIQTKLIDVSLLTQEEVLWLNEFHRGVRFATQSLLNEAQYEWLLRETADLIYVPTYNGETCSIVC